MSNIVQIFPATTATSAVATPKRRRKSSTSKQLPKLVKASEANLTPMERLMLLDFRLLNDAMQIYVTHLTGNLIATQQCLRYTPPLLRMISGGK